MAQVEDRETWFGGGIFEKKNLVSLLTQVKFRASGVMQLLKRQILSWGVGRTYITVYFKQNWK